MSIADTMATNGMKEAGYEYINLDGAGMLFASVLSACARLISHARAFYVERTRMYD